MADFLQASCFHYPIVLRRIYTIALYHYYPITLYHFYLIVSMEDWGMVPSKMVKVGPPPTGGFRRCRSLLAIPMPTKHS